MDVLELVDLVHDDVQLVLGAAQRGGEALQRLARRAWLRVRGRLRVRVRVRGRGRVWVRVWVWVRVRVS